MFSLEPISILALPLSRVLASCKLAVIANQATGQAQERYVQQEPQYSQEGFQYNTHGDPERMTETAIIPLGNVAENPQAASALQRVFERFK